MRVLQIALEKHFSGIIQIKVCRASICFEYFRLVRLNILGMTNNCRLTDSQEYFKSSSRYYLFLAAEGWAAW